MHTKTIVNALVKVTSSGQINDGASLENNQKHQRWKPANVHLNRQRQSIDANEEIEEKEIAVVKILWTTWNKRRRKTTPNKKSMPSRKKSSRKKPCKKQNQLSFPTRTKLFQKQQAIRNRKHHLLSTRTRRYQLKYV